MRRSTHGRIVVALSAFLLLAMPTVATPLLGAPWGAWATETVATVELITTLDASGGIALDGAGHPHIMAQSTPTIALHAYLLGGAAWATERLDPLSGAGGIARDSDGRIHGTWHTNNRYTLTTGTWTSSGLVTSDVETLTTKIHGSRLHIDSQGREHITYGLFDGALKYASREGEGPWTIEGFETGLFHDSAVDGWGGVHVVSEGDDGIDYAYRAPSGGWRIERIPVCYWYAAIAVDVGGHPHISCQERSKGLVYLHHNGAGWIENVLVNPMSTTRQAPINRGYESDIGLDSLGRVHIVFHDRPNIAATLDPTQAGTLVYVAQTSAGWSFEELDRVERNTGYALALLLDSGGRPHISYVRAALAPEDIPCLNVTCFDLRYATPALGVASDNGLRS